MRSYTSISGPNKVVRTDHTISMGTSILSKPLSALRPPTQPTQKIQNRKPGTMSAFNIHMVYYKLRARVEVFNILA